MKSTIKFLSLISGFTLSLAACSSSTTPPATNTKSTAGAAGVGAAGASGSGTAGASGSGTAGASGSGTAGASGSGTAGASGGTGCTPTTSALINDFSGTGGLVSGTPYTGGDPDGTTAPTASTMGGMLTMTFNGGDSTNMYPYAFIGMGLNACTDASTYTGVKFTATAMTALTTGCTIQFSVIDKEHSTATNGGTCTAASCYPGGSMFTPTGTATDVSLPFAGQGLGGANPDVTAGVDPSQILSIQWQANPVKGTGCSGVITISDVMFY